MKTFIIGIDGPAGTGKSTIAKGVAKILGITYVDTGAMYRAVTLYCLEHHVDVFNVHEVLDVLDDISISLNGDANNNIVFLNGRDVSKDIRSQDVNHFVSPVAKIKEVRLKLVELQREMATNHSIIMEGRDICTTVFPNADVKIYMTATEQERANRRYKELIGKGENVNYNDILANVIERDRIDSSRDESPLRRAEDAILIDTTNMTIEEVINEIVKITKEKVI